jgi:hypothetical protein
MPISPQFLSSAGFWLIIIGLLGEAIVIFAPIGTRRLEKALSLTFTVLIAIGVAAEHIGDSEKAGPRHLTSRQKERIIEALRPFVGQQFQMITYPGCEECSSTFVLIYGILTDAGWVREGLPQGVPIGAMQSVLVNASDRSDDNTKNAAKVLVSSLNNDGIVSNLEKDASKDDIVDIIIGLKQ